MTTYLVFVNVITFFFFFFFFFFFVFFLYQEERIYVFLEQLVHECSIHVHAHVTLFRCRCVKSFYFGVGVLKPVKTIL